ncbi:TolC family outer membrane protein [Plastorhodobacter daqingensis]|uniref:TolC family outer membrane protein n=1 Tax=Plastorhodobacter daqingensis TaxID=1387281 RepID=A0ABW2UM59_9RHOB
MSLRSLPLFAAAILTSFALVAPAAKADTLADALVAAYRNSNLLEQNRAVLRASDEDVAQSVAALRPVISFAASTTYTHRAQGFLLEDLSGQAGLSAELTLFDFGRNRLAIDIAQESVLATRWALVNVEQNVLLNAVSAYMNVWSATENVRLRQNSVNVISEELRAARDRFEVGEVTRTDVAIAEARLAAARSSLSAAEGERAIALEAYNAATGAFPTSAVQRPPAPPATAGSLDDAKGIAQRTHPSIRQAQHQVTAAEMSVARAEPARSGRISAGANLAVDQDGNDTSRLSLSYNQPLYTGGANSSLYRQAVARRDQARSSLHQTALEIVQEVGTAWAQLNVARAQLEASDLQIQAAEIALNGAREEAALGARTTLDVLNAEQELLDAQASRVNAEANRHVMVYRVLASMGLLTVEHLNLGIPTYDPSAYYNAVRNAPARSPQGEALDRVLGRIGRN